MKVIVAASPSIKSIDTISEVVAASGFAVSEVLSIGRHKSSDPACDWASAHGLPCTVFEPVHNVIAIRALDRRDQQMVEAAEACVAILDDNGSEAEAVAMRAQYQGLPTHIHRTFDSLAPVRDSGTRNGSPVITLNSDRLSVEIFHRTPNGEDRVPSEGDIGLNVRRRHLGIGRASCDESQVFVDRKRAEWLLQNREAVELLLQSQSAVSEWIKDAYKQRRPTPVRAMNAEHKECSIIFLAANVSLTVEQDRKMKELFTKFRPTTLCLPHIEKAECRARLLVRSLSAKGGEAEVLTGRAFVEGDKLRFRGLQGRLRDIDLVCAVFPSGKDPMKVLRDSTISHYRKYVPIWWQGEEGQWFQISTVSEIVEMANIQCGKSALNGGISSQTVTT